jgi:16S rRNA G966 N2-methylase RsmD
MSESNLTSPLILAITAAKIYKDFVITDDASFFLKYASQHNSETLEAVLGYHKFQKTIPKKIPDWAEHVDLIAPPKLSLEQASSKKTAIFKTKYLLGPCILDLTGGMGVDTYYFSKAFEKVIHNEPNQVLSQVVKYNFNLLGINNVKFTNFKGEALETSEPIDSIFIDPDRRNETTQKMVLLSDCQPNVQRYIAKWLKISPRIVIKLSPMIDIKNTIKALPNTKEVLIISDQNEVKEIVFIIQRNHPDEPIITAINFRNEKTQSFSFLYSEEEKAEITISEPKKYIYEPLACVLKAGAFKVLCKGRSLQKIAANSHIYTSEEYIEDFPGRSFILKAISKPSKKDLEKHIPSKKANISTRNYPLKPEQIKKELGWKDGGDDYLFFTEDFKKKKIVLICTKINL